MLVCSAWRQIVLSIPKLWSDVHLGENVNLARMWLERAGNIPRALETTREPSHCADSNRPQAIQSFICSFPFKKLHLIECDAARIDFTRIPVESLLLLEDLALLEPAWNSRHLRVAPFSPHHFPNLVSLQIDMITMPRFHVSHPFATWKKLRVLRLECGLDKASCLEILRDASSVEDCSLYFMLESYNYQNPMIESAVVANLKILRLSFTPELWSFLDPLTFPNLHKLILIARTFDGLRPWDMPSLLYYVQRFGSLRSLNIHHLKVNVDVGLILEWMPLLQVLELLCEKVATNTVEKIGRGELGGCFRELHDWSYHNFYEFLQACELRRDVTQGQCPNTSGTIASLEKVSVRYSKKVAADCKRRIRELSKDDIEFKVFRSFGRILFD
ncbi:hypothetical protein JOM56_001560 [Amanita muscaria]